MKKFLKKVGIYAAIIGIGFALGALFVLIIISRSRALSGGSSGIDGNINNLRNGITEANELNEDAQELAGIARIEIADSTELNIQIGNEIADAGNSIDSLTAASNRLGALVQRLNEKAKDI